MTDKEHPTLADIIEKGFIWPWLEREMEILIRHGLIPSDPRATEAEKREFLGLDKPNAKES